MIIANRVSTHAGLPTEMGLSRRASSSCSFSSILRTESVLLVLEYRSLDLMECFLKWKTPFSGEVCTTFDGLFFLGDLPFIRSAL